MFGGLLALTDQQLQKQHPIGYWAYYLPVVSTRGVRLNKTF